ncbi:DUF4102 domain-containing protein [Bartonella tribocorum]|uniref:DUF4102 domain-containing protein n=1 Tax=Bartonella tribocorum TaxID=85701 RepID=UPI00043B06C4|nr:DUF4102 domain-containing protein [Bartonella tribocorum]CDO48461.1 hypothetical protein BM1374166_00773 [Bartonella tribocorum]
MPFINRFKCQGVLQHFRAGKVCDGAGLLRLKRKDSYTQWIYHYYSLSTLGNGLGRIERYFLKTSV